MDDNSNWYNRYYQRPNPNPFNRYNRQHWEHGHHANDPDFQENYDYGNYTSDYRRNPAPNPNQNQGSYEGAPSGYQVQHPGNADAYNSMHGNYDYGFPSGNNPDFRMQPGEFRGERWPERNDYFEANEQAAERFYPPQNMRPREYGPINDYYNNHLGRINPRPQGQTMDSWDNDNNHWQSQKYNRSAYGAHRENQNREYRYHPQNQGYFGENIPRHSGGNLYNERFRNEEDFSRYNPEENRWHADSLSDRNIESWGR